MRVVKHYISYLHHLIQIRHGGRHTDRLCSPSLLLPFWPRQISGFRDPRYVRNGNKMMVAGYTDQPYCAVRNGPTEVKNHNVQNNTSSPLWLCVITASVHGEGSSGEQVYSVRSKDLGKSGLLGNHPQPSALQALGATLISSDTLPPPSPSPSCH